jgi:Rps23 Pro-64 3,4-dihydroxylase Tpa1-like proline 4-hydroxylase
MIKTYNNVLREELIEYIMEYFKLRLDADVWSSSSGWNQSLSLISANTLTHQITDKILIKEIKKDIEEVMKVNFDREDLEFFPSIYVWSGGSYITWHDDSCYPYNGTLYLNEEWDSNDGGVFLYKENSTNEINGIEPTYNSMVVNSSTEDAPHSLHCVTCIVPGTVKKRVTLQWRTTQKKKKTISYQ